MKGKRKKLIDYALNGDKSHEKSRVDGLVGVTASLQKTDQLTSVQIVNQ